MGRWDPDHWNCDQTSLHQRPLSLVLLFFSILWEKSWSKWVSQYWQERAKFLSWHLSTRDVLNRPQHRGAQRAWGQERWTQRPHLNTHKGYLIVRKLESERDSRLVSVWLSCKPQSCITTGTEQGPCWVSTWLTSFPICPLRLQWLLLSLWSSLVAQTRGSPLFSAISKDRAISRILSGIPGDILPSAQKQADKPHVDTVLGFWLPCS